MSAAKAKRRPMTEAERSQRDADRKAKLDAAHDLLFAKIEQLTNSGDWLAMLRTAARFHAYSWRNCLMILAQYPEATRVAGYKTWQNLGRQVRKGEPGIKIWAGFEYTAEDDDDLDDDGSPRKVRRTGYKIEHVWDINQTDGEDLPEVAPRLLTGEAPDRLWETLAAQIATLGYELRREAVPGLAEANGAVTPAERIVRVRPDLDDAAAVKTLAHELGHIRCGHVEGSCTDSRSQREVEAESVAYLVCDAFGLDTSTYTIAYVAGWAPEGKELETVSMTADVVVRVAREILDEADHSAARTPDVSDESYGEATMKAGAA